MNTTTSPNPTRLLALLLLVVWLIKPSPAAETAGDPDAPWPLEVSSRVVKAFEKIEFTLPGTIQAQNPDDPDEIEVVLEMTAPGERRLSVPAFFYQPFERRSVPRGGRPADWLYPTGQSVWKARFTPTQSGVYSCVAVLKTPVLHRQSAPFSFQCAPGTGKGFVRVSRRDPRYLEHDDGSPYFAIGQNVAFVKELSVTEDMIRQLGAHGANYARVWACAEDWALAIEARKSAWGRSWDWNPPFVMMPDREAYHDGRLCLRLSGEAGATLRMDPCHPVALRPGTRYRFGGSLKAAKDTGVAFQMGGSQTLNGQGRWAPFQIEFTTGTNEWWFAPPTFRLNAKGTAWLRDLSLRESTGGPELLWEADPNRPALGRYNSPDTFMLDEILAAAERGGVRLQLTLLTRDHYLNLLRKDGTGDYQRALAHARKLVRYAAARWGYSPYVFAWEYFNKMDPGLPTDRFYAELGRAFEQYDVNRHLRTTSAWHSPAPHYAHPQIDTCDMHYYLRPPDGEIWKDEVAALQARWKLMQQRVQDRKPAMLAEFGITDANWQRAPQLDSDRGFVHLHHALWAAALSGFASTPCHWYWDDIHQRRLYPLYQPFARFMADVPFTTAKFRPASVSDTGGLRVLGLQGEHLAILWLVEPTATWWKIAMESASPPARAQATITLDQLPPGNYRVEWWHTRTGEIVKRDALRVTNRQATLTAPAFAGDMACKVIRVD